jgi:ribosomal protein L37AE/L43A
MSNRPGWYDKYWNQMDKETQKRMRTTCPQCGSSKTYYNKQFGVWRCGRCEASFSVKGYSEKKPWWKRLFGR